MRNNDMGRVGGSLSLYRQQAIDAGRIAALFAQAIPGVAVTVAIALFVAAVLAPVVGAEQLVTWLGAMALVVIARLGLVLRYRRRAAGITPQRWENVFALGALAQGAVWAWLALAFDPADAEHALFIVFAIGGVAIGAIGVLGASRRSFLLFVAPMVVAQAWDFALQGGRVQLAMAGATIVFLAAVVRIYADLHRAVVENIERGIDNDRLLAEHRGLLDAATVGIAFVKDDRVLDCNPEFERILGRLRAELTDGTTRLWFADDDACRDAWQAAASRHRAGLAYRAELQLARRDGSSVWCDVSSRSIIPGQPDLGMVVVVNDIEERKRAEARLLESTERLDLVIRASQSGLWDWEIATGRQHVSPRFKEILGFHPDAEIAGPATLADWVHPDDRARVMDAIDDALAGGAGFDEEGRVRRSDDTWVWVHARAEVVRDAAGAPVRFVGSIIDISDRKHVEARLRESEQHFRHLVETANDLVWAVDRRGRWTYLSPRATRQVFGCEPEDLLGRRLTDTQAPAERTRTEAMLARVLADGTASHFQTVHEARGGAPVILSLNATAQRDGGGSIVGVTGTATDITPLKAKEAQLSAALAEQQLIFESVSEGIVFLKNHVVHKANGKFAAMIEHSLETLVGQPDVLWYAQPADWEAETRHIEAILARGEIYQGELLVKRRGGEAFWCEVRGRAVQADALEAGTIWVYIDISARKEREQRIQHLADHDALTGLLNRRLLEDRVRQAIGMARRQDKVAALMLLDLDGFKQINDRFGHLTGDFVLRIVAKRMKECVRETDTVARLGGDEFVVLLTGQRTAEDSAAVAEKILASLTAPIAGGGREFRIGASIGISVYPRDGLSPDALLRHADAAMYRVKEAGKNRYQFYSDAAASQAAERSGE
jgi:diguanylate cyclase (GGDEF)-like protein/PAS domain S-box-containing protein